MKVNIYGFIGCIGGGKTYRADKLKSSESECPCIIGDFSDGVRDAIMSTLSGSNYEIDLSSPIYAAWKEDKQYISLSSSNKRMIQVSGRQLLTNVSDMLKRFCNEDVFVDYTQKKIVNELNFMKNCGVEKCNVIISSVRFISETKVLFDVAKMYESDKVKITFCNYNKVEYTTSPLHESEALSNHLLGLGCFDGEDITDIMFAKVF